jgi:hypothetical protein
MKKVFLTIICSFLLKQSFAQSLTVTGGWTRTLSTANITQAGLNYATGGTLSSEVNQSLINVSSAANSIAYVYIQKSDISWDSRLIIAALRTGTGTGSANFSTTRGTPAQTITNVPQLFMEVRPGSGTQVSNIPIQYTVRGFTVLMPAKTYTTTIIYTISN